MFDIERANKIKEGELPPYEVELKLPLLTHQLIGSSFMYMAGKCLNLDVMGAGKTIQTLGALKLESLTSTVKAVIFAPSSVMMQWISENETFLGWKCILIDGEKSHRQAQYEYFNELDENCILITNYSTPLKDAKEVSSLRATTLILDEVTFAKNPEAKIHSFINEIKKNFNRVYGLSGTPITLCLGDLYWIFSLLGIDNVISTYEEEVLPFLELRTVSSKGRKYSEVVSASGFGSFIEKLKPYFIMRSLNDIASYEDNGELTAFIENKPTIHIEEIKYDVHQADFFQSLKMEANRSSRAGNYSPLETYQFFLQASSSPKLLDSNYDYVSPKETYLLNLVSSCEDKIVVFVRYLEYLKLLQNTCKNAGVDFCTICGKESTEEQNKQKNEFVNFDSKRILFITGAGKYGLNLQKATQLVFIDIPYNPADVLQYIGRIYRLGQLSGVKITMAFTANTLEEDIFRKLYKRQSVLDEFFDTSNALVYQRDTKFTWGFLEKDYLSALTGNN